MRRNRDKVEPVPRCDEGVFSLDVTVVDIFLRGSRARRKEAEMKAISFLYPRGRVACSGDRRGSCRDTVARGIRSSRSRRFFDIRERLVCRLGPFSHLASASSVI